MNILRLFNLRTFLVLLVSQLAAFFVIQFQIKFHLDLLLFGLAIGFPLAFSIQAAFRRRERALEYFSLFKAGTTALHYSFQISEGLPPEKKIEIRDLLDKMTNNLVHQLEQHIASYQPMKSVLDKVFQFIESNREGVSNRNIFRMIRYVRDITESSTYLISLVKHRTMIGLRFYSIAFIFIFPILQAPILYNRLGDLMPSWGLYLLLAFGSLILVTLSNFQKMIEYPFDSKGMDNIHIRDFGLSD